MRSTRVLYHEFNCMMPQRGLATAVASSSSTPGVPFAHAKTGGFVQEAPQLRNPFLEDVTLRTYLNRHLPSELCATVSEDLTRFGDRITNELLDLHRHCELEPPRLDQYDVWGRRVDRLLTCAAWKQQRVVSAEEGCVAIGYETKRWGKWSRLYQHAKLFLYAPSSGLYSCPLAMTDGAAKCIKELGLQDQTGDAFSRLTSRDPNHFWTSGQWMTEKAGGSDVGSGTETIAVPCEDGTYSLHGYKWFSSATDADMTFTLARIVGKDLKPVKGSRGLSMFFLETKLSPTEGSLNGIQLVRLKDKLGTRQLPTAELLLDGSIAKLVSEPGRGVAAISHMLNTTRLHNAIASVGAMRRMVDLCRDYMQRRKAFGLLLSQHPLHVQTVAKMEVETRGCFLMVMESAKLMGLQEAKACSDTDAMLLRLFLPLVKLYTGKQVMTVLSEGLECFGGVGYLEDSGLPSMLRDAQVLPIWEGTTNVLCQEVLKYLGKGGSNPLESFAEFIQKRTTLTESPNPGELVRCANAVQRACKDICNFTRTQPASVSLGARDFCYSLSRILGGALLIDHAAYTRADEDKHTALRWCMDKPLFRLKDAEIYEQRKRGDETLMKQTLPAHL